MLRLITDFDGPIVDISERYYRVYELCLEKTRRQNQKVHEALAKLPPATDTWMVGDTEADIVAAKTHGIKVIGGFVWNSRSHLPRSLPSRSHC